MYRSFGSVAACALALAVLVSMFGAATPARAASPAPVTLAATAEAELLARTAPEAGVATLTTATGTTTVTACTGWRNTMTPPASIKVLRTRGTAAGTVQTVPFRDYVGTVIAAEWPAYYPIEALKAGAIAVKQYGWYYTTVYRGKVAANGDCYDVVDNTNDQYYYPEMKKAAASHLTAIAATWNVTERKWSSTLKTSRFILTGYRAGTNVPCGSDRDAWRLYQRSVYNCATQEGLTWEAIVRRYLDPVEIVAPGAHNTRGNSRGDATVVVPGTATGTVALRTYATGATSFAAPTAAPDVPLDPAKTLGVVAAEVTGDTLQDVVVLTSVTDTRQRLQVLRAGTTAYAAAATWLEIDAGMASATVRLVAGDFDADGRSDAALLAPLATDATTATLIVARSLGTSFEAPKPWWTGPLATATVSPYAGDVTGDGRADLVVEEDRGTAGLRYSVMASRPLGGSLDAAVVWLDAADLRRGATRTIVTDMNRDGRDDLAVAATYGTGTQVTHLRSNGTAFLRLVRWTSPTTAPVAISKVKLGAGDYNIDGRGDLLLYIDLGTGGTRLQTLLTTETAATSAVWLDDPNLRWATARPY